MVKEGSHRQSEGSFAIKIVTKSKLSKEDEIALKDEIAVLQELQHKHIIRLYDVFDEPQFYYLVTEKMLGGELFDRIVQKSYYNEKEARDVCIILFDAMNYCHKHHVAHRDLKPENLLLTVSVNGWKDLELKVPYIRSLSLTPHLCCIPINVRMKERERRFRHQDRRFWICEKGQNAQIIDYAMRNSWIRRPRDLGGKIL